MTNKVKPFYIRITDNMTPQMVQDAFDKCVDAGANAANGCKGVMSKFHYQGNFDVSLYSVFGVNAGFGTYIEENSDYFDDNAQEITLDQLDEWLGIKKEIEWDGKGLPPVGVECEFKKYYQSESEFVKCFIVGETKDKEWLIVHDYADDELHFANKRTGSFEFRPIETPEQKADRERLEAIDSMFIELNLDGERELNKDDRESIYWKSCEWAYDAGYRKQ